MTCKKWHPCVTRPRLLSALQPFNGQVLSAAAVGRELGVSHTTASCWIHSMEDDGVLWLLYDLATRRRPVLVLRSTDPLSRLLEGLERILPQALVGTWRCGQKRRLPVMVDTGEERIGFCISDSPFPRRAHWLPLLIARRHGLVSRGFFVNTDPHACLVTEDIVALPISALLGDLPEWVLGTADCAARREAVRKFNREHLAEMLRSRDSWRCRGLPPDPPVGKMPACS